MTHKEAERDELEDAAEGENGDDLGGAQQFEIVSEMTVRVSIFSSC